MSDQIKRFTDIFEQLPETDRKTLLAFAEFLHFRSGKLSGVPDEVSIAREIPPPEDIPRPERESVVVAIKRLSATYPMVSRASMLDHVSPLMSQHIVEGRDAAEVIDELEDLFRRKYEELLSE